MKTNKSNLGFTLIEVLVALCLLSIILVSLARTQLIALSLNQNGWNNTVKIVKEKNEYEKKNARFFYN